MHVQHTLLYSRHSVCFVDGFVAGGVAAFHLYSQGQFLKLVNCQCSWVFAYRIPPYSYLELGLVITQGGLSTFVQSLRMECIDLLVEMEARLDFDDEMPDLDTSALITRMETMCHRLQEALATAGRGRLLQSGLQVRLSIDVPHLRLSPHLLLFSARQLGRYHVIFIFFLNEA